MKRHHGESGQRQPPIHPQHDHDEHKQQKSVVDHGRDARGEQIVQRVDVGGHARDQAPDRAAVVEAHRQALQALENLLAQVVHRFLADLLHHPHLQVLKGEAQGERHQEQHATCGPGREYQRRRQFDGAARARCSGPWRFRKARAQRQPAARSES